MVQYLRTNNLTLANHFLNAAVDMNSNDPCAFSELGVVAYRQNDVVQAAYFFFLAIKIFVQLGEHDNDNEGGGGCSANDEGEGEVRDDFGNVIFEKKTIRMLMDKFWEPTLNNLGHCMRKMRRYDDAIFCFEKALTLDNEPTARR